MIPRFNRKLNEKIRELIDKYKDTPSGDQLRSAYQGNTSDLGLCEMCNLDPDEYGVEED
jgi:hypothetical protein